MHYHARMYIVAIAWAYVILMMAVTSSSLVKGLSVAFFLGVLPLWLLVWAVGAVGSPRRRSGVDRSVLGQVADAPDRENTEADQNKLL
jgi:hypothetical protein